MAQWSKLLERIDDYRWRLPRSYKKGMRTDGMIFADEQLMEIINQENAVEQVANVAFLPGIVGNSLAMPDIHWGYGFPVGGVAATDAEEGVISPGGIGFDINCGVRLLRTDLTRDDVSGKIDKLIYALFNHVPCGKGKEGFIKLDKNKDLARVLQKGARWAVEKGYGWKEDLEHTESEGCMKEADPEAVSGQAKHRGSDQLGTLGSGNHFLEIQVVQEIYDEEAAAAFGVEKGQIVIMIHTGSRGLGHQVATDYLRSMETARKKYGIELPDRQLACAPVKSQEGMDYFGAMAASANFAWANRQIIAHRVREVFEQIFGKSAESMGMNLIYDVAHNIAKFEDYIIEGKKKKLCIHRKGATRSFGPGSAELPEAQRNVGQAVIIPGDMGRYSYLLKGSQSAQDASFSSTCHGAGRVMSRGEVIRKLKGRDVAEELSERGIFVRGASRQGLAEEAPEAYKDVAAVVNTAHGSGLALRVARMKPLGVMKG
ncbi:MAG: RtcB family protein [Firmicutes bacterium]|nr:RtcB family protein [Bacillota bacterium]